MSEQELTKLAMQLMTERRTIRKYRDELVPPNVIDNLLSAAMWAPSAHNRQPWRFAIITERETKHRLAAAMGRRLRQDLEGDAKAQNLIDADVERSYQRITSSPVIVVVSLSMEDMDTYPDLRRQESEWLMAVQSTAMAGQNLLLAAHAHGLGACWMCAPLFCADIVCEILELPSQWQPQGLITIGYPAEKREKTRASLASRTIYIDRSNE